MNNINCFIKFIEILLKKDEIYLRVKVRPNASETCVKEIMSDETIKIDLAATPTNGKANKELIKFLAQQFNIDVSSIKIISGMIDRVKLVKIKNKN